MPEPNKFVIIDEKPKRGREFQSWKPSRAWLVIMSILVPTLLLSLWLLLLLFITPQYPAELELTADCLCATNLLVETQLTATNAAILTYSVQTPAPLHTLQAIQRQQTLIAATQESLATFQAQTILTLTAVATSPP